ncbi:MAG: cytochrome C [Gemmatimonadota bacterium]
MSIRRTVMFSLLLPAMIHSPLLADDLASLARAYAASHAVSTMASAHAAVPSFSRQTGLACSSCHYQFLSLTPFGRLFKLNGYTLTAQKLIEEKTKENGPTLKLSPIPFLAGMVQTGLTHVSTTIPGTQNDNVQLPQQFSLFLSGAISSKVGIFSQITYSGSDGAVGIDNIDLRFANSSKMGTKDWVYGATINNNPTVSDLWNTTPAWGWPYAGSPSAPGGTAATVIDGALGQQVLGAGGYTMIGNTVYAEFEVYRSSLQGLAQPDATASGTIKGVAPYWRLALQKTWENSSAMIGTYGLRTRLYPGGVTGPTDDFTDVALDAQVEQKLGHGHLVFRSTWIHEKQDLNATFAALGSANATNTLKTFKVNTSYYPSMVIGLTGGYFQTSGTTDAGLYAPAPVTGSATGNPKTSGVVGEFDFNPWQNTRLGVQYVAYNKFNGGGNGYDGSGRNASGNNTLYLLGWLMF